MSAHHTDPDTETDIGGWRTRAADLREQGSVPKRRAEVVALIERDLTHAEVAEVLGIERPGVAKHVRRYREEYEDAAWLAEHGPELERSR